MSAVTDDKYWLDTAEFVKRRNVGREGIVAPREFEELVPSLSYAEIHSCPQARMLVLHKGQLEEIEFEWLTSALARLKPAFANEVFVVLSEDMENQTVAHSKHFKALQTKLSELVGASKAKEKRPREDKIQNERNRPSIYLGDSIAITKTIYGQKIYVNTKDYSLAPHILLDGYWEQWITNVFRQRIKPGMNVLDVGANIGWYSILAADLIGPTGRLTSFEANPEIASILFRNLMINGFLDRAKVEARAVYSESRTLEFQVYEHYLGSSSLFATKESAAAFNDTLKTVTVEAVSLDDFLPRGSKIDFIKIDAEGAEPYILKGGSRVLTDNKDIQLMMEFAPSLILPSYGSMEQFYGSITGLGFTVWRIAHDSTLVKSSIEDLSSVSHCDIILQR